MDGFELNKIAGAVLTAMLVMASGRVLLDVTMAPHAPEKPGWALPVTEPETKAVAKPDEPAFDAGKVLAMLPDANADAGSEVFRKCTACHTPDKGGAHRVGPNLWGIVNRKVAAAPNFEGRYSEAMKSHGGEWSFEQLAKYLHNPSKAVPGNKMTFAGVFNDADLADLLAYLRTLSDNPAPVPK